MLAPKAYRGEGRKNMGYQEKLVYCDNNKDTSRFLEILKEKKIDGFDLYEIITLKRNWNARYKNIEGIMIGEIKRPFNFTNILEIENEDKIYWRQPDIGMAFDNIEDIEGNVGPLFSDEQEHLFNKNDILICLGGDRGFIKDVYSMFGVDCIASNVMLKMYTDGNFPKEYMVNGKIDIAIAKPIVERVVAKDMFSDEENQLFDKVKMMDIDGIENFNSIINDPSLFRHKLLRN